MCLGCWQEAGKPFDASERARATAPLFHDADPFGPLHIVVEDWNLDDDNIRFCLGQKPDAIERDLIDRLLQMSEPERWATAILSDFPNFNPSTYPENY